MGGGGDDVMLGGDGKDSLAGNPDAARHALTIGLQDTFELRWEDLPSSRGEMDYNDNIFSVEIAPT
jgi:hypothetical protein